MHKLCALIIVTLLCSCSVLNTEPRAEQCFQDLAAAGRWLVAIVQQNELKNREGLNTLGEHLAKALRSCLLSVKLITAEQGQEGGLGFPFDFRSANECVKVLKNGVENLARAGHIFKGNFMKGPIIAEMIRLGLDFSHIQKKCI